MTMRDRILLIDGHNLLFQMFYGMPSKILGRDGKDIRSVVGFVGAVGKLIRMCAPTHIAVIFDSATHNPRSDILAEYKANRPDYSDVSEEENPFTNLKSVYRALDTLGIRHCEVTDAECDDVIASYAITYKDGYDVVIASHDSDFLQLIGSGVRIVRYRGDATVICDGKYVMDKFGTPPELYIDAKALYGDTSDNIPGIPGIGPKTAAKLVISAGGADRLADDPSLIENPRLSRLIADSRDIIRRNLSLMRLSATAPLPFAPEELRWDIRSFKTLDVLREIQLI